MRELSCVPIALKEMIADFSIENIPFLNKKRLYLQP